MELKKEYKQTEIGLIPEDWDIVQVKDIVSEIQLGGNYANDEIENSYPLIKMGNLGRGKIKLEKIQYISKGKPNIIDKLSFGDLLFNTRNTLDLVGKVAIWRNELAEAYFNSNLMRIKFNEKVGSNFWVNSIFNTQYFIRQLREIAIGTTSVAAIYNRDFFKLKVPLPNSLEQAAIAQSLSDADAYITSLEKLIEKKKAIKQGAMQELLKPKDGWAWKKLGDIGKTYGGLSGKSKDDFKDGVFPYIPFMNIMTNPVIDLEFLDFVKLKTGEPQNSAQIGDLFFNGSSETPEEVGMCSILLDDIPNLYLNSFCFGFRLKKELGINGLYLTYYFRSKEGRKLFYSMAQGATRYNLSKSNFNKLEVPIPRIEEQNFVANTLRDMDFDIQLHEEKLNKAKSIKQGMMQQLLTGKIRLK